MEVLAQIESVELACTEQQEEQNQEAGICLSIHAEKYAELAGLGIHAEHLEKEIISKASFGQIPLKSEVFNVKLGANNGKKEFKSDYFFPNVKFNSVTVNQREGIGVVLILRCRLSLDNPDLWEWLRANFRPSLVKLVLEQVQLDIGDITEGG